MEEKNKTIITNSQAQTDEADSAIISDIQGKSRGAGLVYAIMTYGAWGLVPIYWKFVTLVPPPQLVAHRVLWSLFCLSFFFASRSKLKALIATIANRRKFALLCAGSILIGTNWLLFVYAVEQKMLLQASLGYFINPLVNVALGRLFLGERLNVNQLIAFCVAVSGVVALTISVGSVPYISLLLALTFGFYGLVRKKVGLDPILGLTTETLIMAPVAVIYLALESNKGHLAGVNDLKLLSLIMLSGPVTTFPLLWFAHAANLVRLSTLGFIQYLSPTLQFLLAVLVYKESFSLPHVVAFGLIWISLAIYIADSLMQLKRSRAKS